MLPDGPTVDPQPYNPLAGTVSVNGAPPQPHPPGPLTADEVWALIPKRIDKGRGGATGGQSGSAR